MASAFFALLRDAAKLAATAADDLAAQSSKMMVAADDIATLTGKAAVKTAGVAGDDLAVGAGQINGVLANRELPILWKISKGSLLNKALLTAGLLVIDAFLPFLVQIALGLGAAYIAYEGAHGVMDYFYSEEITGEAEELPASEDEKVQGAIKTDLVLSFEMLVIALASTGDASLVYKIAVLALVGVAMTIAVYGLIGLIIRLDDMGLALASNGSGLRKRIGFGMANAAPKILNSLGPIGICAMFMVAGGIFSHLGHIEIQAGVFLILITDMLVGLTAGMVLYGVSKVLGRHQHPHV